MLYEYWKAKAFDKKTSVLAYLVKLIMKNDADLLNFKEDVISVDKAENVILEALESDLKQLLKELDLVKKASKKAGDKQRDGDGKLVDPEIKKTVQELKEQKTHGQQISMEDDIEYTPMELFTLQAEKVANAAADKIEETKKSFVAVLNYFGEDEKMSTSDFFGTLKKFFMAFGVTKESVDRQEVIRVSFCSNFLSYQTCFVIFSLFMCRFGRKNGSQNKKKKKLRN